MGKEHLTARNPDGATYPLSTSPFTQILPMKNQREKRSRVHNPSTRGQDPAPPADQPLNVVSPKSQRACLSSARDFLAASRDAHIGALVKFEQTNPTSEDFAEVMVELEAATKQLISARDAFRMCCATI